MPPTIESTDDFTPLKSPTKTSPMSPAGLPSDIKPEEPEQLALVREEEEEDINIQ